MFPKSIEWWVNDILMVFFFLQVGLELKREMKEGFLSDIRQVFVPCIAALGGICCPAIIYAIINNSSPQYMHGWAIPTATDIAFAVCVLMLVGKHVPQAAKIFYWRLRFLMTWAQLLLSRYFIIRAFICLCWGMPVSRHLHCIC